MSGFVAEARRESLLDEPGSRLFDDVLAFADRSVTAVVLLAGRLVTIAPATTVGEVEALVNETGYFRFAVRSGAALTG